MSRLDDAAIQHLLSAYANGVFPMAASADTPELYLQDPDWRGIIPLDRVHIPKRLARTIRQDAFDIRINTDFDQIIDGCAAETPDRGSTWINREIRLLYRGLFERGNCHTVEVWDGDGALVGGLYGVSLRGAFFGESMFSRVRDVSKIALIHLCARLIRGGFMLLDTQFTTTHLEQFGTEEIARRKFRRLLREALEIEADFMKLPRTCTGGEVVDIVRGAASFDA